MFGLLVIALIMFGKAEVRAESDITGWAHTFKLTQSQTCIALLMTHQCVTHPELVGPELVDVGALSGYGLVPEAELQQELVSARHQHLTPLLPVRCEVLPDGRTPINKLYFVWWLYSVISTRLKH